MTVRRPLVQPLVPLYRAAVALRNRWHDQATHRGLHHPVVSIGSIATGGAGKTPFLITLARFLQSHGYAPDVLSRGYGRASRGALRVDPGGTAHHFGDEPLLLARTLDVPVYVGSSRYAAGRLAEATAPPNTVHLLDDGFSHRTLHRALDIALITLEDVRDTLLPAGNLREPLEAIARADIFVLRTHEAAELESLLRRQFDHKPLWTTTRTLVLPPAVPAHPIVFSAIARPADFEAMVRRSGIKPAGTRRFADHHTCTPAEIDALRRYARASHADGFLTTAKDAVKLTPVMLATLQGVGPVTTADVHVELQNSEAAWKDLQPFL